MSGPTPVKLLLVFGRPSRPATPRPGGRTVATRSPGRAGTARRFAAALVLLLGMACVGAGADAAPARKTARATATATRTGLENLERQVREFTLPNGLRFLVVERHQAPVFSFQTVVNAGSANDAIGTTGLAHMMEHMAFKGTPIVGTSDHAKEKALLDREEAAWSALLDERR
jgi:hypothetical protein